MNGSRPIPLLLNHDHTKAIGKLEYDRTGELELSFTAGQELTRQQLFGVFGDCGIVVLEEVARGGVIVVTRARILEWSFSPAPARPG